MSAAYWSERWANRFRILMLNIVAEMQEGDKKAFTRFVKQNMAREYTPASITTPAPAAFRSGGEAIAPASGSSGSSCAAPHHSPAAPAPAGSGMSGGAVSADPALAEGVGEMA